MWLPERAEAHAFLREHLKNENLVRHCIATEAVMVALARRLAQDERLWGLTGLFHDLDLDLVQGDMKRHARETARILEAKGFPKEGIDCVVAHNGDELGFPCTTPFHHCLVAGETITGMIVACTLVYPSRKVADVKPSSVRKRMKEPRFAANVRRERIEEIGQAGIPLDDFILLALEAMKGVAAEIGL